MIPRNCTPLCLALLFFCVAADKKASVSLDEAFKTLATFEPGQSRVPLKVIDHHLFRSTNDAAQKQQMVDRLCAVLKSSRSTHAARLFVCQKLAIVGTEKEVPLLAELFGKPETREMARRTLEAIPGRAAGKVLRDALRRCKGDELIAVIHSLGRGEIRKP